MEINYERSGGFAGMRISASFDLDELEVEDATNIRELLQDADFHQLPEEIPDRAGIPDQFTYKITVVEGTFQHTVTTGDASAPPELRPLIDLLSQLARTRGRGL